jgi:hypothetical protein
MVARIRGRSFDELRVRAIQALYAGLERLGDRFPGSLPVSVRTPAHELFDSDLALLAGAGADPGAIARAVAQRDPETCARLMEQSDAAERGVVALLGYERLWVGSPPRWHREAKSGTEAPRRHWSRIDHLDTTLVGDHKLLWELNRHQYLLAPAFCWLLDRDARRFELVQAHLESWLEGNPPRRGVNWVSSLEVSYRAIAWCWLLWMLREAPWRPDLRARLLSSLAAHARHVERYLSTYFSPNTHLTGEALGLFYVGTVLSDSSLARRWRSTGAAILESAIGRQVYADGVYFEQASQYHRYSRDLSCITWCLSTSADSVSRTPCATDWANCSRFCGVSLPRRARCRCSGTTTADCYSPWIIARLMMCTRCSWLAPWHSSDRTWHPRRRPRASPIGSAASKRRTLCARRPPACRTGSICILRGAASPSCVTDGTEVPLSL